MKHSKIYLLQEMLVAQINNLILYPIVLTLVMLFKDLTAPVRPSLTLWILCGFLFTFFYLARCRAKNFISFMAVHIAVIAFIIFLCQASAWIPLSIFQTLQNGVNRFMLIAVFIGFAIYSVYLRMHEATDSETMPMPMAVGVAAVALFLQHYQGFEKWDSYYSLPLILVFVLYFLHYYVKEYLNFLIVNASSTGVLPEKEIFSSGIRLAGIYTLMGALILFFTSQLTWLKEFLGFLRQIIYNIIRFIFSHMPQKESEVEIIIDEKQSGNGLEMLPEGGEPSIIWDILAIAAIIGLAVVLLFALYKAILKAIEYVKAAMNKSVRTHEKEMTDIHDDVREKCEKTRTKKKRQSLDLFGFMDTKERIRRIYKKTASSYKPVLLSEEEAKTKKRFTPEKLSFYTAKEMEREMQSGSFSEIYEKARYSDEVCTGQDVKRMKELCR